MNVGVIDADLLYRKRHRFPNLASMKISGFHKIRGDTVTLILDPEWELNEYDVVYVSKVFTDTSVPDSILHRTNVKYGGTGFNYDNAEPLSAEIEHCKPDYHLYDEWVEQQKGSGVNPLDLKYYTDYSIGFLTRGCFRHCSFCVNRNYNKVSTHSPLSEFVDDDRPKICLLDDNFLGYARWKELLSELQATGKSFQFKQGLDERILTEEKCEMLFKSKYDGDYIFAFDNIEDADIIVDKLKMIRRHTNVVPKFYVFCGYDRADNWDARFWKQDIEDVWKRIEILMQYQAIPYIMRFNRYAESPYRGLYITLARWCNQPSFFKKMSLEEFITKDTQAAIKRYFEVAKKELPDVVNRYYRLKFSDYRKERL